MNRRFSEAWRFYAMLAAATLVGSALDFTGITPVTALFWAGVINGLAAGPILFVMMLLATRRGTMKRLSISRRLAWSGWVATALMIAASAALLWTIFRREDVRDGS